ncbi:MAG: TAXI family TRAP transporter solute-binding subunit [bacterium]|nr:TAXI family TRAP transporter solute-binding subunit [bacterium]
MTISIKQSTKSQRRRFINNFFFLLILLCTYPSSLCQSNNEDFLLSSGSIDGNYYKVGSYISQTLDSIYNEFGFINVVSTGSIENVRLLDERFSDFAISQRDVLLDNIYDEINGIKNIELVLPLFKENFLIYSINNGNRYKSFADFAKEITTIGVTSKDGYSYKFFIKLCKLTGVDSSNISVVEDSYSNLAIKLKDGTLDAITSFSLPIKILEELPNVTTIGLSSNEASLVTNKVTNVFLTKNNSDKNVTVGSWTFLVGLDTSISVINDSGKNISQQLIETIRAKNDPIAHQINTSLIFFKNKENHRLLNGIPLTDSLIAEIHYNTYEISYLWSCILLLICLSVIYYIIRKNIFVHNYKVLWARYKHIIIGIICIVLLYFLSVEWLLFAEKEFYKNLEIKSRVLNLTRLDLHFWIIVTNLTGNNNNIFPFSYLGQLMLSFSSYILWVGAAIVAFWEFLIYKINKKRLKGMTSYNFAGHIVIIGWKENSLQFVEELLLAKKSAKKEEKKIVFIVEDPERISEGSEKIKNLQITKTINFVAGDAREEDVLRKANLHKADTVAILSEGISTAADEKTLLRALAISRYCRKMSVQDKNSRVSDLLSKEVERLEVDKYEDSIYIIAELNHEKYKSDLINADVNEIINASEYSKNILTQTLLNHGISKVLDEILSFNEDNEFYVIDLKENKFRNLHHKTFDELLPILRKKGILLIAIRVVFHDKNGHEIIDVLRIETLLKTQKLHRQIIINPTLETEIKRTVDADDQLIVFCSDGLALNQNF